MPLIEASRTVSGQSAKLDPETAAALDRPLLLVAALCWARAGWPVFPLVPGTKVPFAGSHGALDATTDEAQIVAWWTEHPDAGIAGVCSGRIVIDVDTYKDGVQVPAWLPPTTEHACRGTHLVYTDPDPEGTPCKGKLSFGIDIKAGPGQYVALPPTVHPSGRRYAVRDWRPPVVAPADLVEAVRRPPVSTETLSELPDPEPIEIRTRGEVRALHANPGPDPSNHSYHVAIAAYRAGRTDGQVRTLLEQDEITAERWSARPHLRDHELLHMLPRARSEAEASKAREEASVLGDDDEAEAGPDQSAYPCLPDEFWEARPELAQIRQAAQSRLVSPDAVLAAVLVRVSAMTHYRHLLPPVIGRAGTLDLLVGIIAPPGFGKGGAMDTAEELLPGCNEEDENRVRTMSLGSGEGMAAAYFERVQEEGPNGRPVWVVRRTYNGVLFSCDEGSAYKALAERSGQTTSETIRQMFFGERLGGTYVGASKDTQLPKREYRGALILAIQPVHAQKLLSEWDVGTPLRFLWSTARDPNMPPEAPGWPGPLSWKPSEKDGWLTPGHEDARQVRLVRVASSLLAEIRETHRGKHTGTWDPGQFDAHRDLVRLKTAALLGSLRHGNGSRPEISRDDWRLAGLVMATSDEIRGRMLGDITTARESELQSKIDYSARRVTAETSARMQTETDLVRVARILRRYCAKRPDGTLTRTLKKNGTNSGKDRQLAQAALEYAEAQGWLAEDGGRWRAVGDGE